MTHCITGEKNTINLLGDAVLTIVLADGSSVKIDQGIGDAMTSVEVHALHGKVDGEIAFASERDANIRIVPPVGHK